MDLEVSLTTETVVRDRSGMEMFGIEPVPMHDAMATAVAELERDFA